MPTVNGRGFDAFNGETIVFVNTTAINVVHFHTKSGKIISVDVETSHHGFPVVSVGDWKNMYNDGDMTWNMLVPTHTDGSNDYAHFEGVWQCFYNGWESARYRSDKFFESGSYEPDDKLKPITE